LKEYRKRTWEKTKDARTCICGERCYNRWKCV